MTTRRVIILGSTGSIGTQALDVIARNPARFTVAGLGAGANVGLLARQAVLDEGTGRGLRPRRRGGAGCGDRRGRRRAGAAAYAPEVLTGPDANEELAARPADVVLNGITGSIGLRPTLAALAAGTTLALANKESLIVGGPLVKAAAAPGQIVPVDSEHSALAQCLRGGTAGEVRRLVLTASGGPFRGRSRGSLRDVTPERRWPTRRGTWGGW